MTTYINARTSEGVETVDEYKTYKEAREMLAEYNMAYHCPLWISSRSTREWRESGRERVYNHRREIGLC